MLAVSARSWDTTMLVRPSASLSRRISRTSTPMAMGSWPTNGSSYMRICGSRAIARASATRRFMPPDSSSGISSKAPRRPTACSFISTMSRIISSGRLVCTRSGKATFSNTSRSVNRAPLWNSTPICLRMSNSSLRERSGRFWPLTITAPLAGRSWAPIRRSRVVLPQPEGPMMPVTLPRGKTRSTLSKMVRVPRLKVTPFSSTAYALSLLIGTPCVPAFRADARTHG
ncbi:hypothetical protein D3C78_859520 [compost metagenome]